MRWGHVNEGAFTRDKLILFGFLLRALPTVMINIHLKDVDADGQFCPRGADTIDLRSIVGMLQERDDKHWLIVDEVTQGTQGTEQRFIYRIIRLK